MKLGFVIEYILAGKRHRRHQALGIRRQALGRRANMFLSKAQSLKPMAYVTRRSGNIPCLVLHACLTAHGRQGRQAFPCLLPKTDFGQI